MRDKNLADNILIQYSLFRDGYERDLVPGFDDPHAIQDPYFTVKDGSRESPMYTTLGNTAVLQTIYLD